MKKTLLTVLFFAVLGGVFAQSNLDFEIWTSHQGGYDTPNAWVSYNSIVPNGAPVTITKDTNSPGSGTTSAVLETVDCTICPQFGLPSDTLTGLLQQETAISQIPVSMHFVYRYAGLNGDAGVAVVEYFHWDNAQSDRVVDGQGVVQLGNQAIWTAVQVPITDFTGMTPDSVGISFASSIGSVFGTQGGQLPLGTKGSVMRVDDVVLNYATTSIQEVPKLDISVFINAENIVVENVNHYHNGIIEVLNVNGQVVTTKAMTALREEITGTMAKGVYIINMKFDEGVITKKVFKH